jgi:ribosomal protein S18 acetylase RimI-like enzyme
VSEIRFRPATPADDDFFLQMEFHTTWESLDAADRDRLNPDQVRDALAFTHELLLSRPGNRIIVAENEARERLGLLWVGVNRNLVTGEDEAWVYGIAVVEGHQGLGIGRRLMEHAERLAREAGHQTLGLMVSSHNERARALYERLAFETTNLLMRKRLT